MDNRYLSMASIYYSAMASMTPDIETEYSSSVYSKAPLNKRQKKSRLKTKKAKKARKQRR